MKLRVKDVISHMGQDFVVEAVLSYRLSGKVYPLVRAVDGIGASADVRWVEPLMDDVDDRLLLFTEVKDLDMATPPPATISYRGGSYVPRLSGTGPVAVAGRAPDRPADGAHVSVWRYRAAGDLFLQIEKWQEWPDRTIVLAGESVHKGMVDVLPGPGKDASK